MCHGRVLGLRRRGLRCSCVLQLSRRRVRGTHGLGVVSYVWRLAGATHWLRRILEGWIGILRAPVRSRCRRRCPRRRVMGSWGCGVGKVVCGRRILNIARLGIRDARRRACRGRGTRKGRGLRIARSLVRREIGVVPHGNGFAGWSGRHFSVQVPQCLSQTSGRRISRSTHVAYC